MPTAMLLGVATCWPSGVTTSHPAMALLALTTKLMGLPLLVTEIVWDAGKLVPV